MAVMFASATYFNQDLSKWDMSNVDNMAMMFAHAASFNQDLSNWDVSHVTMMVGVFEGARYFNQNLSNWDVSRVTDTNGMFAGATSFDQDLSKWDVSRVTSMKGMFRGATSFGQTLCGVTWVHSKAQKDNMFKDSSGSICAATTIPTHITPDAAPLPSKSATTTSIAYPAALPHSLFTVVGAAAVIFIIVAVSVCVVILRTKGQVPVPEAVIGSV
jgi:surface protein